jgi:hypothetical protein
LFEYLISKLHAWSVSNVDYLKNFYPAKGGECKLQQIKIVPIGLPVLVEVYSLRCAGRHVINETGRASAKETKRNEYNKINNSRRDSTRMVHNAVRNDFNTANNSFHVHGCNQYWSSAEARRDRNEKRMDGMDDLTTNQIKAPVMAG